MGERERERENARDVSKKGRGRNAFDTVASWKVHEIVNDVLIDRGSVEGDTERRGGAIETK